MLGNIQTTPLSHQNASAELRSLTLTFGKFAEAYGVDVLTHRKDSLSRFETFAPGRQKQVIENFRRYLNVCVSSVDKNIEPLDERHSLVWYAIGEFGLRPPGDLFSHLQGPDLVEIYDLNHVQMFRTLNMFHCLSYSIEELITYEWPELY